MTEEEHACRKDCVVVDLDGTLCNSAHRDHLAQAKLWDDFHGELLKDEPHIDVLAALRCFYFMGFHIVAVTGRDIRFKIQTEEWLARHDVPVAILKMRPKGDYTSDHDLKPQLLAEVFDGDIEHAKKHVLMVLDDREKVVEAWRNHGFKCWQVQPGGY